MTTANVTPIKIARAMEIRKANPHFIQAVDNPQNARDLSDAAKEARLVADIVVDVAVGSRTGVPPDERALALTQLVDKLPICTSVKPATLCMMLYVPVPPPLKISVLRPERFIASKVDADGSNLANA